jgi:hypothetical protein
MDRAIPEDVRSWWPMLCTAITPFSTKRALGHSLHYQTPSEPFHPNCAGRRHAKRLLNLRSSPIRFLTSARPRPERESAPGSTNSLPTCRSKPMFARVLPVGHDNLCLTDASRSCMPLCNSKIATMPPSHRSYFNLDFTFMIPRSHIYETIACAWRWRYGRSAYPRFSWESGLP